ARDGDRSAHAAPLDPNWLRLYSGEGAHERADGRHRTATPSAADRGQRLALRRRGLVVDDHADRPVAGDHWPRGVEQHRETQTVHGGWAVRAALDVKHEPSVAGPLGRPRGKTRGGTGTDGITAARLEVVTADPPRGIRHRDPPSVPGAITSRDRPGARSR